MGGWFESPSCSCWWRYSPCDELVKILLLSHSLSLSPSQCKQHVELFAFLDFKSPERCVCDLRVPACVRVITTSVCLSVDAHEGKRPTRKPANRTRPNGETLDSELKKQPWGLRPRTKTSVFQIVSLHIWTQLFWQAPRVVNRTPTPEQTLHRQRCVRRKQTSLSFGSSI